MSAAGFIQVTIMELNNSMDLDEPYSPFKTQLSCGEVVAFHKENKNLKGLSFVEKLLDVSGLSIAPITTEELEQNFQQLKDTIKNRWLNFYQKWKNKNYNWRSFNGKPEDVFIDLSTDFPGLINYEEVALFGSQVSVF